MASTNPLVIQGTLSFPPDEGVAAVPVQFGLQATYQAVLDTRLVMSGVGVQSVPFGSIASPGVKAVLIEFEAVVGATPVEVRFNGSADGVELSPGGFIAYGSPNPGAGITAIVIERTGDAVVRVRLFG